MMLLVLLLFCCHIAAASSSSHPCDPERNGYMLGSTSLCKNGFDWWWHHFTAQNSRTGEYRPFFIEYFIMNPCLGGDEPILGQASNNTTPSYGMIKAGTWGEDAAEIMNYYAISQVNASINRMDVHIGENIATDFKLKGSVRMSQKDSLEISEYMSDSGEMSWDLAVNKTQCFQAGYATSRLCRSANMFEMFWHVRGISTNYEGIVMYNGERYTVVPETSFGYADKNWGSDYTNPWLWFNARNWTNMDTGLPEPSITLVVGGGLPTVLGMPLFKTAIIAFFYQGKLYEFNFSKMWKRSQVSFNVDMSGDDMVFNVEGRNMENKVEIVFSNPKSKMLYIDYENPRGEHNHKKLWNGGHASGIVKLYKKKPYYGWTLIGTFYGQNGGCEWGEH